MTLEEKRREKKNREDVIVSMILGLVIELGLPLSNWAIVLTSLLQGR